MPPGIAAFADPRKTFVKGRGPPQADLPAQESTAQHLPSPIRKSGDPREAEEKGQIEEVLSKKEDAARGESPDFDFDFEMRKAAKSNQESLLESIISSPPSGRPSPVVGEIIAVTHKDPAGTAYMGASSSKEEHAADFDTRSPSDEKELRIN